MGLLQRAAIAVFSLVAALVFLLIVAMGGTASAADLGGDRGGSFDNEPIPYDQAGPFYAVIRGGLSLAEDTNFSALGRGVSNTYDDYGYFISGAVGYDMSVATGLSGFRGELELGSMGSDVASHQVSGLGTFNGGAASGDTSVFFGFANLYYDFSFGSGIRPFVGGGLGLASVSLDNHGTTATGQVLDGSDTTFAWNIGAGATFDVTQNASLELGYRYIEALGAEIPAVDGTRNDIDVSNHVIYTGLKYRF